MTPDNTYPTCGRVADEPIPCFNCRKATPQFGSRVRGQDLIGCFAPPPFVSGRWGRWERRHPSEAKFCEMRDEKKSSQGAAKPPRALILGWRSRPSHRSSRRAQLRSGDVSPISLIFLIRKGGCETASFLRPGKLILTGLVWGAS